MEEKILLWEFLFVTSFVPARNYLFKVCNLNTRIRCESCSILRMSMLTMLTWFILKRQTFLKARSGIWFFMYYFIREQNLLTKSIWTYTITTLWVNQWVIFAKEFTSDVDSGKKKDVAHVQNDLLYVHLSFYRFCLQENSLEKLLNCNC